jgi:hypothetical protein
MKQIVPAAFFLMLFSSLALSQISDGKLQAVMPNLLEKIDLKFNLTGTPNPEDVGFDYRNGSWKLKYELLLSNEKTISDLITKAYANCKNTAANYQKCAAKANKKLDKQFKKIALFISRGAFERNSLSSETEREIFVLVKLTSDVIRIFNDAAQSVEKPVFLLQIKSKVSAKTSTKKRIRYKTSTLFQYPLKLLRSNGSFDFYNITVFGASISINKESEGRFSCSIYKK